jgi:hypothetical protein
MALQTSGAITISDIKAELGNTSNSLEALSLDAGFTAPHAMSDFYGYSAATANLYYWNFGENDGGATFTGDAGDSPGPFSFSLWIRPSWAASDVNVLLFEINANTGVNTDRLMLIYDYGFNRLVFRYRAGSSNHHINWDLGANAAAGNISRWHGASRGPVNSDGFVHLAGTFDPTQSAAVNGLKLYWNGVAFNTIITQANGTRANFPKTNMYINVAFNANADRDAEYDNVAFWFNRLLTASEVTTMYNSGAPITAGDAGLATGLGFEATAEGGGLEDTTGNWSQTSSGGSVSPY